MECRVLYRLHIDIVFGLYVDIVMCLIEDRVLWIECRALWMECRVLYITHMADFLFIVHNGLCNRT